MMYNNILSLIRKLIAVSCIFLSMSCYAKEDVESIKEAMRNRAFFFVGYPGSGKGTQGKQLASLLGVNHLSTGELFRAEAKKGTEIGKKMNYHMQRGEIIPKELTFEYLKQELSSPKYQSGLILDGYPKDVECFHFIMETLHELGFEPTLAFNFQISREEVVYRLTDRLHCAPCERDYHKEFLKPKEEGICDLCQGPLKPRADDFIAAIHKRLDVFEKNTGAVVEHFKETGMLVPIKATKEPEAVTEDILESLSQLVVNSEGSYYLKKPEEENSSVFHNHIDAKNHQVLKKIVMEIEADEERFQNKIYPVGYLTLGPQIKDPEFTSVYSCLPNFHGIDNAIDEAFTTGKMGEEGFDYDQILKTLEVVSSYSNCGIMTELEEDIFEKCFDIQGEATVTLKRGNTPYVVDWSKLPGWQERMIEGIARFELHHGFDIMKAEGEETPPIDVEALNEATTLDGFNTGGWFVFRKKDRWAYRSNEFSNEDYEVCLSTLETQADRLREIVEEFSLDRPFISSCSLEKVHAMWRF